MAAGDRSDRVRELEVWSEPFLAALSRGRWHLADGQCDERRC